MKLSQKLNASAQHLPTILDGTQVVPIASIHVFHPNPQYNTGWEIPIS